MKVSNTREQKTLAEFLVLSPSIIEASCWDVPYTKRRARFISDLPEANLSNQILVCEPQMQDCL